MEGTTRRNDVGSKVLVSVVAFLIITIIGFSIGVANKADSKANANTISVTRIETTQMHLVNNVAEIKSDVKDIRDAVVK